MAIPFHVAAERAANAMSSVNVECECPICDRPVECVVNGDDVTVGPCAEKCGGRWRSDLIIDYALAIASTKRAALAQHYREGGR